MSSDYEFEYQYDEFTWTVNLSYDVYKDRMSDDHGDFGPELCSLQPDEITILDHNLEDITFYVRCGNPKLYKTISNEAEERATESMNSGGAYYDEDAWKGYD